MPAYIYITEADMVTDYIEEGSASHKIIDAKVFVNDISIGVYELPRLVPVLADAGPTSVALLPNIRKDGIAARVADTEIHEVFHTQADLQIYDFTDASIDTIRPVFTYQKNDRIQFAVYDFDQINSFESKTIGGTFNLTSDPSEVFEGSRSGVFRATTDVPAVAVGTSNLLALSPTDAVYLELDYRTTSDMEVYLTGLESSSGRTGQVNVLALRAREAWNKVYVELSDDIGNFQVTNGFQPDLFEVGFIGYLPDGAEEATFFIDNVKVVSNPRVQ